MAARWLVGAAVLFVFAAAAQRSSGTRRWQQYEHEMQDPADDPPDAWEKTEFAFARLRYRSNRDRGGRGWYRSRWGIDANKSERQFIQGLRRLTRVHARSVEQIVDIESDDMYDWPWLYAVGAGDWDFSPRHAERLKKFFERGGFLMVDDFHNEYEWAGFMEGIHQVLPGHAVIELAENDPIFHSVYDLSKRVRVPGLNVVHGDQIERGGIEPRWRAVVDDQGRVLVAICFNQDLGDAWEWADLPEYPEQYASMAYRLGVNYVIYALTH
ncbi:MAG: DUF4159 domain-containing protein [Acidobacteria bacterium]|nr:DUF4159 domain-containing protein [Acidobacteriota bacterium]